MGDVKLTAGERAGMERAAKIADAFAEENFRMATDTIFTDPLLTASRRGEPYVRSAANEALVEKCMTAGTIHSSMAHAAQNIASSIRAALASERKP